MKFEFEGILLIHERGIGENASVYINDIDLTRLLLGEIKTGTKPAQHARDHWLGDWRVTFEKVEDDEQ